MQNREGTPIWYELMTKDPDAAQEFYGSVMGWTFEAMPGGLERDYRIASFGGTDVGGIMLTPGHAQGMPDTWFMYVGVEDVDASTGKVRSLGGRVDIEPTDIPGVGRFSFVADPQGALFYLMRGDSDEPSKAFSGNETGHCVWNELVTSDQKAALVFYGKLFGWQHGGAMPMGEAGDYTFINHGGEKIGAVMNAKEKDRTPYWNFALRVGVIDTAKSAIEKAGGRVRKGPLELPDDNWLILADDCNGAKIMFTGPREKAAE